MKKRMNLKMKLTSQKLKNKLNQLSKTYKMIFRKEVQRNH